MQQRIGRVRILGRRNARGLLDHARADEADLRSRLGDQNVAERSEAGGNPAECGVRQNGNEGELVPVMHRCGRRNFGHLHQRKHALLHAGTAAGGHADERDAPLRRFLKGVSDFFAHHGAHGPTEKREIEYHQNRLVASDAAKAGRHSLTNAGLAPGIFQANAIRFVIGKAQRIDRHQLPIQFAKCPFIREQRDARAQAWTNNGRTRDRYRGWRRVQPGTD